MFDYDGNGYIDLDEMTTYLGSVFKVLYATEPGTEEQMGVSSEELARVTAEQAFVEADLDQDGRISLEEFKLWYAQPGGAAGFVKQGGRTEEVPSWLTLAEARRLTNLHHLPVPAVCELFINASDDDGRLDRMAFNNCFEVIVHTADPMSEDDMTKCEIVVDSLFDLFDTNGDERIDTKELTAGLSVLCNGGRDEKVEAAFAMFDYDGNGYIDLDEMTTYLGSVFKVLYATEPGTEEQMGVSSEELARVTAEQAFVEADLDQDGRISLEEFKLWYAQPGGAAGFVKQGSEASPDIYDDDKWLNLSEARRLTNLQVFDVSDVIHLFTSAAESNGEISRAAFNACFEQIIGVSDLMSDDDMDKCELVVDCLFDLFDIAGTGAVNIQQLCAGLSVLCGGNREQKVGAAFDMFDLDGNGYIDLDEMTTYLGSVFTVLYAVEPGTEEQMGVSSEELARVTAEQAFVEADLDQDGRISLEEFKLWYAQPGGAAGFVKQASDTEIDPMYLDDSWLTLSEARRLTNLQSFGVAEVMQMFVNAADDHGSLKRSAYNSCFETIVGDAGEMSEDDMVKCELVVDGIFDLFCTDNAAADGKGSDQAAESKQGPSEGKEEQKEEPKKPKKKYRKLDVPVKSDVPCMNTTQMNRAFETEQEMQARDADIRATADKRNELETYIYAMRDRLIGDLKDFADDAGREALSAKLTEAEDWLYGDEGFDSTKAVYAEKLEALQNEGRPLEFRKQESVQRPQATSELMSAVEEYARLPGSEDETYAHIDETERETVRKACADAEAWLKERLAAQEGKGAHEDPAVTAEQITAKKTELRNVCRPIATKPKPLPPKKEKEEGDDGNGAKSGDGATDGAADGDGTADAMDTSADGAEAKTADSTEAKAAGGAEDNAAEENKDAVADMDLD
eukprot:g2336.t1